MTLNDIYHAIDPVALSLGPLQIRWYGLAYVAGFICAFLVIAKLSQRWKIRIDDDAFFTVVFCVIFGVILGGRLGYVLVYGDGYYLQHPEKILAFNEGGMSFHGGLVGVIIGGVIAAKITKIPFLTLADMG
ncbi:prolipoprotein diacylglyceryl transferase family protein, partial [Slackia sp.]